MNIPTLSVEALTRDGVLVLPSLLSSGAIETIKSEIEKFDHITFNDRIGSLVISENKWIDNLALCSETATNVVLHRSLLNLADGYFGQKAVLGSFRYQKKIKPHKAIPPHSDKGPGLVIFIFLNRVDRSTGATRFIKGSHVEDIEKMKLPFRHVDTDYVRPDLYDFDSFGVEVAGGAGTILIFSQKIIHDLPAFIRPGRELVWATYYPQSDSSLCDDLLFNRNALMMLSEEQRSRVLFQGVAKGVTFTKMGEKTSITDSYNISTLRRIFYLARYAVFMISNRVTEFWAIVRYRQRGMRGNVEL